MKVKDVLYYALIMCGKEDLAASVHSGKIPADNAEIARFINCYDLTVTELSEEVEPLVITETLTSDNGKYYYTSFSKPVKQILKVEADGRKVDFKTFYDRIEVAAGEISVTYDYRAARAQGLNDDVEYGEDVFSARVLALGVAAEYSLIAGMFEEAKAFRQRYERSVESYVLSKNNVIRARRWA